MSVYSPMLASSAPRSLGSPSSSNITKTIPTSPHPGITVWATFLPTTSILSIPKYPLLTLRPVSALLPPALVAVAEVGVAPAVAAEAAAGVVSNARHDISNRASHSYST